MSSRLDQPSLSREAAAQNREEAQLESWLGAGDRRALEVVQAHAAVSQSAFDEAVWVPSTEGPRVVQTLQSSRVLLDTPVLSFLVQYSTLLQFYWCQVGERDSCPESAPASLGNASTK